ncbi:MAG: cupin domain-containing protein [Actinobacteria bacterium]|nr:cupin domain-containing protein [Actinomycetota bacterium]
MTVSAAERVIAVGRGEGKTIPRPQTGGVVTIKVASELSDNSMTVYESTRLPDDTRGPGMHAHPSFDELFYVVEGEYEFMIGDRSLRAVEGGSVFIPRGVFHDFHSTGEVAGRLLTFCTPGGIEDFFEDLAQLVPGTGIEEVQEIQRKHGFRFASQE